MRRLRPAALPTFVCVNAQEFDFPRVSMRDRTCKAKVVKVVPPMEAKPVYIQLLDGDKTKLVQAWRVSAPNFVSSTSF